MASAAPPWAELPRDITAAILHNLGVIEMLTTVQSVCIDMPKTDTLPFDLEKMCRCAVDRSQGQLIDINIENFGSDELLLYISQWCSQLKRLQLLHSHSITSGGLVEALKSLHLLEELHIYYTPIDAKAIEDIGRSCPLLKLFTLNNHHHRLGYNVCNMDVRAVARNMPQLRHLQLFGNKMTNKGLQRILDGCPHLESFDLRQLL